MKMGKASFGCTCKFFDTKGNGSKAVHPIWTLTGIGDAVTGIPERNCAPIAQNSCIELSQ